MKLRLFGTTSSLVLLVASLGFACAVKTNPNNTTDPTPNNPTPSPTANNPTDPTETSTGSPSTSDSGVPSPANDASTPPVPETEASCITACQTQYPKATTENNNLDSSCFTGGVCAAVCNDLPASGMEFPPDTSMVDGGFVCDTAAAGSWPISTPSAACSTCLAESQTCCSLWTSIFGSTDGQALSNCAIACYNKFPN